MPSFTHRFSDLQERGAVIEITLARSSKLLESMDLNPVPNLQITILAMIDTGASGTIISQGIAEALQIYPIGETMINTPSSTNFTCFQYHVQMIFTNQVIVRSMIVTEAPLQNQHIQCLIGRDVLEHGILIYNGSDGSFTLSF